MSDECSPAQISSDYSDPVFTGRYPLWSNFSICSVKYCLLWNISLSNTKYIVSHLKSTMGSTAPNGANFLGGC